MNRHQAWLLGYLAAVVTGTLVHDPLVLAVALAVVLLSARRRAGRLWWRATRAALPVVLAISLGYLALDYVNFARQDLPRAGAVVLVLNLRVALLTMLAFRILPQVDLQQALGFSPTLRFVLILATSQVLIFRRLFRDFQQALTARSPRRVGLLAALRHGAATSAWFLRRAEHDATEITQALETRGYFLDRN